MMLLVVVSALVALASAQHPSQRLGGVTVKDFIEKSAVQFSAYDRTFILALGALTPSFGGSSSYREGIDASVADSQVTVNVFSASETARVYGVVDINGGSAAQRTFDIETTATGELTIQERSLARSPVARSASSAPADGSAPTRQSDYVRANVKIPESEMANQRARRGTTGQPSPVNTACGVFLDIDASFYNQWGVGSTETEKIEAAINKASSYLQGAATIYQNSFGGSVVLEIAGAKVFTTGNLGADDSVTTSGDFLNAYSVFLASGSTGQASAKLRGALLPSSQEVCLNVAVTHRNFGGVVGVAYVGSAEDGVVGGICSNYMGDSKKRQAFNTGFVDSWGSRDATIMSRGIAHEIGHAFGADHCCCDGSSLSTGCDEYASCSNPFLMFYMLSYGTQGGFFAATSKDEITSVVQAKGNCLTVPRLSGSNYVATTHATAASTAASSVATAASTKATTKATTKKATTKAATTKKTKKPKKSVV